MRNKKHFFCLENVKKSAISFGNLSLQPFFFFGNAANLSRSWQMLSLGVAVGGRAWWGSRQRGGEPALMPCAGDAQGLAGVWECAKEGFGGKWVWGEPESGGLH